MKEKRKKNLLSISAHATMHMAGTLKQQQVKVDYSTSPYPQWGHEATAFATSSSSIFLGTHSKLASHRPANIIQVCNHHRGQHANFKMSASHSDVVVIGAGLAGLSTAFELARQGQKVRILTSSSRTPAGQAAAGMLAPNAEQVTGSLLDLCRASLDMYPTFISQLRDIVPEIDVCYNAYSSFLMPNLDDQPVLQPSSGARSSFLNHDQLHAVEPTLGPRVTSATHSLDDASVDSILLMEALRTACERLGVHIEEALVQRFVPSPNRSTADAILTKSGDIIYGAHFIVASGAWSRSLLPNIPIQPLKGQVLSLVPPPHSVSSDRLQHILFGRGLYIIPKRDGSEYVVGATVEHAGFCTRVTAGGVAKLLNSALEYVPAFADYEISKTWTGFRPITPDYCPVFGLSEFDNVSVASGFYRNGVLLTPVAGRLASAVALGDTAALSTEYQTFIDEFSANRFICPRDGTDSPISPVSGEVKLKSTITELASRKLSEKSAVTSKETTEGDDARKPKMFKILEDGTREPIYPPPGWEERMKEKAAQHDRSTMSEESDSSQNIKMFKILKDGTQEPINPPPGWNQSSSTQSELSSDLSSSSQPTQPNSSVEYNAEVANPEEISAVNDAYDDVLLKGKDDKEEHGRIARAKNRAFGRTKSSLETEGTPVLSLSEDEVAALDKAFEAGLAEMEEFEKTFDANDPSVLATEKDKTAILRAESSAGELHTGNINGVSMMDGNSNDNTIGEGGDVPNLSTDGYF